MKGEYAFCPRSGAPLSEKRHYDEWGRARRVPVRDDFPTKTVPEGELTNGALRSARVALFNYFRRSYRRHHETDDEQLFMTTAVALVRLKRAAKEATEWDMVVWYALGERLAVEGYDVVWMSAHVEPRCPGCAGPLKYLPVGSGLVGRCATNCDGDNADQLTEVRELVRALYADAFDADVPAQLQLL